MGEPSTEVVVIENEQDEELLPEEQRHDESDHAYQWFVMFLENPSYDVKHVIEVAEEERAKQEANGTKGYVPTARTLQTWSATYNWYGRRGDINSRAIKQATTSYVDERAAAYQIILQNEATIATTMQERIMTLLEKASRIIDESKQASVYYRAMKAYELNREIIKDIIYHKIIDDKIKQLEEAR